uniref:MACPF domain-containing protein n=1 Tax=Plectus sambesii TaxID=2011161 RepID=A0A914X527_9BILA
MNGNAVYRLPANLDEFHFAVQTTGDLVVQTFSSRKNFVEERSRQKDVSWDVSGSAAGMYGAWWGEIDASASFTHTDTFDNIYKAMKDESHTLYQVSTEIIVAQFVHNDEALYLDSTFRRALDALPTSYHISAYLDFFTQFGIVYVHSGVLGGRYSNYYVYSHEDETRSDMTVETMKECLKVSVEASFGYGVSFEADFTLSAI